MEPAAFALSSWGLAFFGVLAKIGVFLVFFFLSSLGFGFFFDGFALSLELLGFWVKNTGYLKNIKEIYWILSAKRNMDQNLWSPGLFFWPIANWISGGI